MRSDDFQRIYIEFGDYYHDKSKGEREYYDWLHALSLDESKPYGYARESFKWAKSMLNFLREDADNKYYGIIVGLPIMSMNGNIYHERDLIAAALSLKGKHPSLNHKDSFWFNKESRWGTLTVEDAKYEDGAVEALLKVPKSAVCPICNGAKMTELIDNQHIVNVSLEGRNNGAFEFTDPPFTLLTSDVLPGIPLARIKPLEKILSEAFHSTKSTGKEKLKYIAKIIENNNPNTAPTVNTNSMSDPNFKGTFGTPITTDAVLHSNTDSSGNTTVLTGSSPGDIVMKQHEAADENPNPMVNKCPEGQIWDEATGQCVPMAADTEQPFECKDGSCKEGNQAPDFAMPVYGGFPATEKPKVIMGSSPGSVGVKVGSAPFEMLPSLEERKATMQANLKALTAESKALKLEEEYDAVYTKLQQYIGANATLNQSVKLVEQQKDEAIRELHNKEVERDSWRSKYERELSLREEYKAQVENYRNEQSRLSEKYNAALSTNLSLSQKLTKANEEYLEVAKQKEATEEALERSRIEAKKIVKIRV